MRKIFIDCGANVGQSISNFVKKWEDYNEYEIHSFEPHPGLSNDVIKTAEKHNLENFHFHNEAISDIDGEFNFYLAHNRIGSSLENTKDGINLHHKVLVKTIDLSKWISNNFSKDDFIILKIDIEGSEYRVMKHLFETNVIEYVNEVYFENHYDNKVKIDKSLRDEVNDLIANCKTTKIYTDKHSGLNFIK
jgi:FkbM family methyltransferase